jgi:ATP-dependent Lon protease
MSEPEPEHSWVRTWLDRILELPWASAPTTGSTSSRPATVLDADHDGLDDVKDRIVEFLAVRKLRHEREVAEQSRGRRHDRHPRRPARRRQDQPRRVDRAGHGSQRFVRVALGGVRDEAEIRGHRRTYVGSPAGSHRPGDHRGRHMNPVVLLDEVDKLSAGGWSGDPTAALLEVLDPAQNHTFRDHYLEVELDLSEVVFIATANVADGIPAPLLDRMELVRLDGYTEDEKVFIARRHLLPRQLERAGLRADEVTVTEDALRAVVTGYTREAGVRSLERELGKLARKVAAKVATGADASPVAVDADTVARLARPSEGRRRRARAHRVPGVATGLAVTGAGGDVLFVETTAFPIAGTASSRRSRSPASSAT